MPRSIFFLADRSPFFVLFHLRYSPFADPSGNDDQLVVYKNIMRGRVVFPKPMNDAAARDMIKKLLVGVPTQRYGCLKDGAEDIKKHKWYSGAGFDWNALLMRQMRPPIVPVIKDALDTSNFDAAQSGDRVQPYHGSPGWCSEF